MDPADLGALAPFWILALTAVVVLLAIAVRRSHRAVAGISAAGLIASAIGIGAAWSEAPRRAGLLLVIDGYALFFIGLTLAASFAVVLLAHGYLRRRSARPEEFYVLLLLSALGACVLAAADHFASFFLGLEMLSVGLYALIAYLRPEPRGVEAGLKYLVLAGISSALLLFGLALIYTETGTMQFPLRAAAETAPGILFRGGLALVLAGIAFKLGLVPFHMWAPDVYEGAPAPAAAFLATASKGAVFALFLRLTASSGAMREAALFIPVSLVAIASMFVGNLLALFQRNVKRLLGYSSISQLGYLLVALAAGSPLAVRAVLYYFAAYFVTMLGAFGVVASLSGRERDADDLDDYRGLYWRRPWTAAVLTTCLLSLAGIPVTAGFVAKFYVLAAGVGSALWVLVLALVVNSAIGLFYYLRVIVAMFQRETAAEAVAEPGTPEAGTARPGMPQPGIPQPGAPLPGAPRPAPPYRSVGAGAALAALMLALVWLGLYPAGLERVIFAVLSGR